MKETNLSHPTRTWELNITESFFFKFNHFKNKMLFASINVIEVKRLEVVSIKASLNYVVYALIGLESDWFRYLVCSQVILNSSLHDISVCQFSSLPLSNFDHTKNLGVYVIYAGHATKKAQENLISISTHTCA